MNNLCIIPARSGSKRVKNKNFKEMLGKPIIEYSIETALKSGFDKIIISSDKENELYFINQPDNFFFIKRSEKNLDDNAILFDVVKEVLDNLSIDKGKVCILYPTACLTTPEQIVKCRELLNKGFDTVFPVIETGMHHQKILDVFGQSVVYKYPQFNVTPSQACSKIFAHSGTFFYCDIEKLLRNKNIITTNCGCIKLKPWEACEVDELDDWNLLEIFMKMKYNIL